MGLGAKPIGKWRGYLQRLENQRIKEMIERKRTQKAPEKKRKTATEDND